MAPREPEEDWTYKVARVAGFLGFNEMRVRWKLMQLQRRSEQADQAAENRRQWRKYEHQICPRCGALNDKEERDCFRCQVAMPSKVERAVSHFGISPTLVLAIAMVGIYVHMWLVDSRVEGGGGLLTNFSSETLIRFGSGFNVRVLGGEWWRLATPMFLHLYLIHLGFNLYAFFIVGPPLERIYGRARVVFFFFVTGILASLASTYGYFYLLNTPANSVGASGALMGLLGVAAGWGHRQKTPFGLDLRNQMVRWAVFVILFGFFIGADNFAHAGGFVAGGVLGLLPMDRGKRGPLLWLGKIVDWLAVLATAATIVVVAVPLTHLLPAGEPLSVVRQVMQNEQVSGYVAQFRRQEQACDLHRAGNDDQAIELLGGIPRNLDQVCEGVEATRAMCAHPQERATQEDFCAGIEE